MLEKIKQQPVKEGLVQQSNKTDVTASVAKTKADTLSNATTKTEKCARIDFVIEEVVTLMKKVTADTLIETMATTTKLLADAFMELGAKAEKPKADTVDERFMLQALEEASLAESYGEVPVGAVLVNACGELIARSGNRKENEKNPLRHAEMIVLEEGIQKFGKYLTDMTLYVTLEPCPMCAGAMVNARVKRLVFGAYEQKSGAAGTVLNIANNPKLNHTLEVIGGIYESECREKLSEFFKRRREDKKCLGISHIPDVLDVSDDVCVTACATKRDDF